ncbi:hypothetical protein CPC08DRAFT_814882 [Agrocybe pediades]|nr:hypothetical protein CPC08DRAFT_814882 [Agrocybe pediades]
MVEWDRVQETTLALLPPTWSNTYLCFTFNVSITMSNGPPTPPATTPAELQDEARLATTEASTSGAADTAPILQGIPEIYQSALPAMIEAIGRNDYKQLVKIAEHTDCTTPNGRQSSRLLIVAPMVLGHLILDDLTLARYALVRLPDHLLSLPISRALMSLVTVTTKRQHAAVYAQATSLQNLVLKADYLDKDLVSMITALLAAFTEHFRLRTFALLSKAYVSLPLSLASTYFSLPSEQIIQVAQEHWWSYDASSEIFTPKAAPRTQSTPKPLKTSSLSTFHFVADSVARLEV